MTIIKKYIPDSVDKRQRNASSRAHGHHVEGWCMPQRHTQIHLPYPSCRALIQVNLAGIRARFES
jgi:hypothetical protein